MVTFDPRDGGGRRRSRFPLLGAGLGGLGVLAIGALIAGIIAYQSCKFEVRQGQQAVLIRLVGHDLEPGMEIAAPYTKEKGYYKGIQPGFLTEGRYFYNPFYWDWEISDQFLVPQGQIGVRVDLVGENLPVGQILAEKGQKGIRAGVIESGARVAYNPYETAFEKYDLVEVYPGGRGVVTLLAGKEPTKPNTVLVQPGERGVQEATLPPGKYPINPYEKRVSVVDCRTQRFQLAADSDISFLASDGFSISLDGVVSFRVMEEKAAEVYVLYNEVSNGDAIEEEIVKKIITPYARSISRIDGSKLSAVQFISGDDKAIFQQNLQTSLEEQCENQGVDIVSVAITGTQAPAEITAPVMAREEAKQKLEQFLQEKLQQDAERMLKIETLMAEQKAKLVEADQTVIEQTTKAQEKQTVAITGAEQRLAVAKTNLEATKDKAAALLSEANAAADVIRFKNTAELAGVKTRVDAFSGDGGAVAQNLLLGKLAPAYRTILSNSEGPLMELFGQFMSAGGTSAHSASPGATSSVTPPMSPPSPEAPSGLPDDPFGVDRPSTSSEAGR